MVPALPSACFELGQSHCTAQPKSSDPLLLLYAPHRKSWTPLVGRGCSSGQQGPAVNASSTTGCSVGQCSSQQDACKEARDQESKGVLSAGRGFFLERTWEERDQTLGSAEISSAPQRESSQRQPGRVRRKVDPLVRAHEPFSTGSSICLTVTPLLANSRTLALRQAPHQVLDPPFIVESLVRPNQVSRVIIPILQRREPSQEIWDSHPGRST